MGKAFFIGDLAKRTGKSVHAIRWYETRGLVPGVERDAGGRRVYHPDHVGWLDFIARLRATGMTIARIADYARLVRRGRETLPDRIALLEDQRAQIAGKQQELEDAQTLIAAKISYYRQWNKTGKRPPQIPSIETVRAARSGKTR
jgi:DNA-binding transcriptional MerR regulator